MEHLNSEIRIKIHSLRLFVIQMFECSSFNFGVYREDFKEVFGLILAIQNATYQTQNSKYQTRNPK